MSKLVREGVLSFATILLLGASALVWLANQQTGVVPSMVGFGTASTDLHSELLGAGSGAAMRALQREEAPRAVSAPGEADRAHLEAPPGGRDDRPLGLRDLRLFFFRPDAWDSERILASRLFNPSSINVDVAQRAVIDQLVKKSRALLEPQCTALVRAHMDELAGMARTGKARRGPPAVSYEGQDAHYMSMTRPAVGNVQIAFGPGPTYVAAWSELPSTRQMRVGLALTIMEHVIELVRLLERQGLIGRVDAEYIVFSVVDIATSY